MTRRSFLRRALRLAVFGPVSLSALVACATGAPSAAPALTAPTDRPSDQPPAATPGRVMPTTTASPAQPTSGSTQPIVRGVSPTPTAGVEPTPTPVDTPTPTATPVPYVAARIKDVLGKAETSFAGSIPERAHNVKLATSRLNGKLIPPGAIFSFNRALGPTTLDAGYQIGYGITLNGDRPQTVPSVAGGICQVATTLFQAIYWAGLGIVEHNYHLYWIDRYGQPPSGRIGLDATVDDPYADLRFRNTTDDWLRIESWIEGERIGFVVFGVQPGWQVKVTEPLVTNVVKTDPTPVRQEDPTMPAGKEIWIEHAEDGFTVTMTRQVFKAGRLIDEYTFTHKYLPSRNVLLVGTKGATPTPTGGPATASTGTPAPGGTPTAAATPHASGTAEAAPTPTPPPAATFSPEQYRLGGGKVRVPSLIGLPERQAKAIIEAVGLANTHTNYQGRDQVPEEVLRTVPVGAVLSQIPQPGQIVLEHTVVFLAVRKE